VSEAAPGSASGPALLDIERLTPWLDRQGIAPGKPITVTRLGSGFSNEMFELRRGDEHVVLRRPAHVALDGADRGIRREYRILQALEGTAVPHAAPLALCDDDSVAGCTFYVMRWIDGFMPVAPFPEWFDGDEQRRALSYAVVDVLADLGALDWRALGLADFGHPDGFHARQRDRWLRQYGAYPRQELDGIEDAAAWLGDRIPTDWTPGIMHGDYHMGNLLIAPAPPPAVAAVCDWETATIGDPLLDLAAFVRFWTESHNSSAGWPSEEQLVARYAERSGRTIPDLAYYSVLARFRLAVMMEGIYQRSFADPTRTIATEMHDYSTYLVSDLKERIARS
jgi:aminoglycoside phosphotransferase (APT) family kinase protein